MHGVDRILLTLQPVARHLRKEDLDETVLPAEGLPIGNQRRGVRAQVGPQKSGVSAYGIRSDDPLLAVARTASEAILEGLLEAPPLCVESPAVIVAPQPLRLDVAVGEIRPTMRAMTLEQPQVPREIAVEDEILAEDAACADGGFLQLTLRGNRVPIAAQILAHPRPRPNLGEKLVCGFAEHLSPRDPRIATGIERCGVSGHTMPRACVAPQRESAPPSLLTPRPCRDAIRPPLLISCGACSAVPFTGRGELPRPI